MLTANRHLLSEIHGKFESLRVMKLVYKKELRSHPLFLVYIIAYCGNPGSPSHGYTNGTLYTYGSKVTFYCDAGAILHGPSSAICQENASWSNVPQWCKVFFFILYNSPNSLCCLQERTYLGTNVYKCWGEGTVTRLRVEHDI